MTTPTLEDRVTEALTTRAESITIDRPPPLGSLLDRSGPGSSGGRHRPNATAIAAGLVAFVLLSAALLIATRVPRDADRPATTSVLPAPVIVPRVGLDLPEAEIRQVVNLVDPWDPSAFPPHTPTSTSSPRAIYRQTGGDFAAPWFVLAPVSIGPAGTVGLPTFPPPDAEDLGDGAKLWFVDPVGGIRKAAWRRGDQMLLIKTAQLDTDEIRRVARSIHWTDGELPSADATGYSFVTSNTNVSSTARYGSITYVVDGTEVEVSTGPTTDDLNIADTSEMVTWSPPPYDARPRLGQAGVLVVGAPSDGCPEGCAWGRWYDPTTKTATVVSVSGGPAVAAKVVDHLVALDAPTWLALARDHRPDPTQAWSCLPEPGVCQSDAAAFESAVRQGSISRDPTGHVDVPGPPPWLSGELHAPSRPPTTQAPPPTR